MENLFYRSSTRVLTSRGMITFDEVNESDDLFYINCDGELSKTNNFHLLKVVSSEINYISGKHLNIEYIGNFTSYKNENRLEEFNMNRPFNLKIANLYDYEKKEFDKDFIDKDIEKAEKQLNCYDNSNHSTHRMQNKHKREI